MLSKNARWLVGYVLLAAAFGTLLSYATGIADDYRLSKSPVRVSGIVTGTRCSEHMAIAYEFRVDGKAFGGSRSSGDCPCMKAGNAIQIYYLSSDPSVSILKDPSWNFVNNLIPILMATLGFPLVFVLQIWAKMRRS